MVSIKDRNGMDLTEQKILRRGGKHNIVKQADSGLGGWMLRNFQGESLKPITSLRFVRLPSA